MKKKYIIFVDIEKLEKTNYAIDTGTYLPILKLLNYCF